MSKTVRRTSRGTILSHRRVPKGAETFDADDNWQARIYRQAEQRLYEANHEQGRQRLRDRIGVLERPPRTLRERCLGIEEEKPPQLDIISELRRRRKVRR